MKVCHMTLLQAGNNPANGPPQTNHGEIVLNRLNVLKSDRVDQSKGGHVAEKEGQHDPEESIRRIRDRATPPQQACAEQVQDTVDVFLVK